MTEPRHWRFLAAYMAVPRPLTPAGCARAALAWLRFRRSTPCIPGFSQGQPEPARLARHRYGAGGTIHQTGTIDVQLRPDGTVYAVWFRCLNLPFRVSRVDEPGEGDLNTDAIAVESVTYVDRDS